MYRKFFGLTDYPFNDNPDPRYFCSTPDIDKAFTGLMRGVSERRGLILLTGEVGTGKTTLLKMLLDRLDKNLYHTAFVCNPRLNALHLLDFILSDFGIEHEVADKGVMLGRLKRWLTEQSGRGGTAVLVIDEAQDLSPPVLEEVRLLNNLETPVEKLLQIVISGQPELEAMILRPEFRALRLRVAHWAKTRALSLQETDAYIDSRLRVAGGNSKDVFTPESVAHIHRFSRGIPRLINLLCAHSMISAYADSEKPVPHQTVQDLASEFELDLNAFLYRPLLTPMGTAEVVETSKGAAPPASTPEPARKPPVAARVARPPLSQPAEVARTAPKVADRPPTQPVGVASASPRAPADIAPPMPPPAGSETAQVASPAGLAPPHLPPAPAVEKKTPALPRPTPEPAGAVTAAPPPPALGGILQSLPEPEPRPLSIIRPTPRPPASRLSPLAWAAVILLAAGLSLAGYYYLHQGRSIRQLFQASRQANSAPDVHNTVVPETTVPPPATTDSPLVAAPESPEPGKDILAESPGPSAPAATPPASNAKPAAPPSLNVERTPPSAARLSDRAHQTAEPNPSSRPAAPPATHAQLAASPSSNVQATSPTAARLSTHAPQGMEPNPTSSRPAPPLVATPPTPKLGGIEVTTNPDGAQISLDGHTDPTWIAPHTFAHLPAGVYTLSLTKSGYRSSEQRVEVVADQTLKLAGVLSPQSSAMNLLTIPPGADVVIDGKPYGASPVHATLPPGQHTYAVSHAGFEPQTGTLTLNDQDSVSKTLELRAVPPKPAGPNLQLATTPPGATVYMDGAPLSGLTPASFRIPPGNHTLIFVLAGYRAARKEVSVPADDTLTVQQTLTPQ